MKSRKTVSDILKIFIGDCYGVDAAVQNFLAEMKYSCVTVFTAHPKARHNAGRWREITVDSTMKKIFTNRKKTPQ